MAILSVGPLGNNVETAIRELESTPDSCSGHIAHYDMRFLKPLDEKILKEVGEHFTHIITIEDGIRNGGLGTAVVEWMSDNGYSPTINRMGLPDRFIEQGTIGQLQQLCGLDTEAIKHTIKDNLQ